MIYLLLVGSTLIFLASLEVYRWLRAMNKNKAVEWLLWIAFSVWILVFGISLMSFLKNSFPEFNRVLAVVPIALGSILFGILRRKEMKMKGFNRNDP